MSPKEQGQGTVELGRQVAREDRKKECKRDLLFGFSFFFQGRTWVNLLITRKNPSEELTQNESVIPTVILQAKSSGIHH